MNSEDELLGILEILWRRYMKGEVKLSDDDGSWIKAIHEKYWAPKGGFSLEDTERLVHLYQTAEQVCLRRDPAITALLFEVTYDYPTWLLDYLRRNYPEVVRKCQQCREPKLPGEFALLGYDKCGNMLLDDEGAPERRRRCRDCDKENMRCAKGLNWQSTEQHKVPRRMKMAV